MSGSVKVLITQEERLAAFVLTRIRGVLGETQERNDIVLVGNYEQDREICEAVIAQAQRELNSAGDDFDTAWAWHNLDEAYVRLAHVVAREALARKRSGRRIR